VPSKLPDGSFIIAAGEIAEFTVCPRAWHLRQSDRKAEVIAPESATGTAQHQTWAAQADHLFVAAWYAKFVIGLTVAVLFVWECTRRLTRVGFIHPSLSFEVGSVLTLLVSLLGVLFFLNRNLASKRLSVGITNESKVLAIDGSELRETREYVSERLKLAGRPDAIISESGVALPVEYKPNAKKVRDRYVAQLLVYLRLIEESHGVRPPHGYLVIGAKAKRIKIENTKERQQWLQAELDTMRAVLSEAMPAPTRPHPRKCAGCVVKHRCPDAAIERAL